MAWCKVSSLTAAVSRSLGGLRYPATRIRILAAVEGKTVEGWELHYFLGKALKKRSYPSLRIVMEDLEAWIEEQT